MLRSHGQYCRNCALLISYQRIHLMDHPCIAIDSSQCPQENPPSKAAQLKKKKSKICSDVRKFLDVEAGGPTGSACEDSSSNEGSASDDEADPSEEEEEAPASPPPPQKTKPKNGVRLPSLFVPLKHTGGIEGPGAPYILQSTLHHAWWQA